MHDRLFAYGTLEDRRLMARLTGRRHAAVPARLVGWACHVLRGRDYPGLVREPGAVTEGTLYVGIEPVRWRWLDEYEGDEYRRVAVDVELPDGRRRRAWTYVVARRRAVSRARWRRVER